MPRLQPLNRLTNMPSENSPLLDNEVVSFSSDHVVIPFLFATLFVIPPQKRTRY